MTLMLLVLPVLAFSQESRTFSGVVTTPLFELVPGASLEIKTSVGVTMIQTDAEGRFSTPVPKEPFTIKVFGRGIEPLTLMFGPDDAITNVRIRVTLAVPQIAEKVTIEGDALAPDVERRDDSIYRNNLFGRDDQVIFTLNAGINAGQHEGGGKSLEIRRFGFNLDHGGVNGGVKILVDNIQQNQGTQGHGQGYLGNLKSLSPELVADVSIINGPFSAAYGDFSGLGVVQIRQRESLPQQLTLRFQGGSFGTFRTFAAFSPKIKSIDSFFAYELSKTDGPFVFPLEYRRDNLSGNITKKLNDRESFGFKFNFGRNDFFSSGQIPLDLVASGELDRFGAIDPENGGRVKLGSAAFYYRRESESGTTLKVDAFAGRSLFDLFSNFTFFLADPVYGDEIQQHDSRLQEGASVQVLKPWKLGRQQSLLTVGGAFHLSQINVGLYPTVRRNPNRKFLSGNINNPDVLLTSANANVNNYSTYVQNSTDFFNGHLRLEAGLRLDYFDYKVDGFERSDTLTNLNGSEGAYRLQPKFALAWTPFEKTPATLYVNYGRGISSQDARGVIRNPDAPKISTTDFYQAGASFNGNRFSAVFSGFLIDNSNQQVYIPDDGSIEFAGRSRSYGFELRNSVRISKNLSFNGGLTQVIRAYYPGEFTLAGKRVIVDSAPHTVANASFVLSDFKGFNSTLAWRHISNYRLDADDESILAAGNDVVDLSVTRRIRKWIDVSMSIDNLFDKRYFETQNYFESRTCPTCDIATRIHATPGYSRTLTFGVTFRLWAKTR